MRGGTGAAGVQDVGVPGPTSVLTGIFRFYASSMLGDVVIVRNSGEQTVDPANGLNGWNLSWSQWKAGSAV